MVISCMMIDAEMYGMMPRAKIVKRDSAPPENMLNMPRMPALLAARKARPARTGSMPGHRDVRADAEDDQRAEQEQQPPLEVAVLLALADVG